MKKAGIIGHFGIGKNLLNGQTVKTKVFTSEIEKAFGKNQILKIDTHGGYKALARLPFQVFSVMCRCQNILIFPTTNGLKVLTPLLSVYNVFFRRKLHYIVIGGWLPQFLKGKAFLAKLLKKFSGIYVETNAMKTALEEMGFDNVFVMPNCKDIKILEESELVYPKSEPFKICTFSRVMKEKGIEDAVTAIKAINEKLGRTVYELDIYGQVDSNQTDWFESLQKEFPSYVRYGGLVPFDKSVDVLKNYFALLFPTYYEGEGFAGTIIDAFAAGVPVIASDWKYNSEIVTENTGILFSTRDTEALIYILEKAACSPDEISDKKIHCINRANNYQIDKVMQTLISQMKG